MKHPRSNNGGEYYNKGFSNYYSNHGIHREKTVVGAPQENGVGKDE